MDNTRCQPNLQLDTHQKAFGFLKKKYGLEMFTIDERDRIGAMGFNGVEYLVALSSGNLLFVEHNYALDLESKCKGPSRWLTKMRMGKHIEVTLMDYCKKADLILVEVKYSTPGFKATTALYAVVVPLLKQGTTIEELCIQCDLESDSRHDKFF